MTALPTFVPKAPKGHKYVIETSRHGSKSHWCSCGQYFGGLTALFDGDQRFSGINPRTRYDLHKVILSHA